VITLDPTTLIVSAVTAGVAELAKASVSLAVKDAYSKLKALLQKRFGGKPEAELALVQVEKKPEVWEAPFKDAVVETGAAKDDAIVQAAQSLLKLVQPQQANVGKYNVQIGEGQGTVVGDNAQVKMTFDGEPESRPE